MFFSTNFKSYQGSLSLTGSGIEPNLFQFLCIYLCIPLATALSASTILLQRRLGSYVATLWYILCKVHSGCISSPLDHDYVSHTVIKTVKLFCDHTFKPKFSFLKIFLYSTPNSSCVNVYKEI